MLLLQEDYTDSPNVTIGSRKGGASGAIAGALNGILQSAGGAMLSNAGTAMGMSEATIANIVKAETYLRGINVSYDRKDGFGIKANVSCRSPKCNLLAIWRWNAIGKHGVTLREQELHLVNKVCKGDSHKLFQEASLYF